MDYLQRATEVLNTEIAGLQQVRDELDGAFVKLVDLCKQHFLENGKLVLTGVGKSGHVGQKIAATLASTGSPAVFMHPVEAMHGDLGLLAEQDLLLALSYSGETDELLQVLPAAQRLGATVVAWTAEVDSTLADFADLVVRLRVPAEACPFNLAPTTSATAAMAFGDALAIVLMEDRRFSKEDYSRLHPAGAIGRAITLRVRDLMRGDERTPRVTPETSVRDALVQMTACRSGSVLVTDGQNRLVGLFTDGDFRRHITDDTDLLKRRIDEVMTADPTCLQVDQMAVAILQLLEEHEFDDIPVVDDAHHAVGLVDIQDLPKFKLM